MAIFHTVSFSFDEASHQHLKFLAEEKCMSISGYLRQLIRHEYENHQRKQELDIEKLLDRIA